MEKISGHHEIRKLLGDFLSGPARGSTHKGHIIRISFVTDDVAIVDGEALIEGGEFADSSNLSRHRFTDILIHYGDIWLIAHIRAYVHL